MGSSLLDLVPTREVTIYAINKVEKAFSMLFILLVRTSVHHRNVLSSCKVCCMTQFTIHLLQQINLVVNLLQSLLFLLESLGVRFRSALKSCSVQSIALSKNTRAYAMVTKNYLWGTLVFVTMISQRLSSCKWNLISSAGPASHQLNTTIKFQRLMPSRNNSNKNLKIKIPHSGSRVAF